MANSSIAAPGIDMAALKAAKKELRTLMKSKLSSIPASALITQSQKLHETLSAFPPYTSATRVSIYLSMPTGEIQTDAIVRSALSSGKKVFIPYLHANPKHSKDADGKVSGGPKKIMDMVALKGLEDYEALERDGWGIPTVSEEGLEGRERVLGESGNVSENRLGPGLDLILMPGVAFEKDEEGVVKRLGHGRGFYDFFLERYREAYENGTKGGGKIQLYGVALEEQVLQGGKQQAVPVGPLDSPLDGLVVGDGRIV